MKAGKTPRNDTTRRINQANEFYDKKIQRSKQKNEEMIQKIKYVINVLNILIQNSWNSFQRILTVVVF